MNRTTGLQIVCTHTNRKGSDCQHKDVAGINAASLPAGRSFDDSGQSHHVYTEPREGENKTCERALCLVNIRLMDHGAVHSQLKTALVAKASLLVGAGDLPGVDFATVVRCARYRITHNLPL